MNDSLRFQQEEIAEACALADRHQLCVLMLAVKLAARELHRVHADPTYTAIIDAIDSVQYRKEQP